MAGLTVALLGIVSADFYMHNPAGGNDRNRERNQNRNNDNRLFDSQNNGNGGAYLCRRRTCVRARRRGARLGEAQGQ
jgi:hypothetical protein